MTDLMVLRALLFLSLIAFSQVACEDASTGRDPGTEALKHGLADPGLTLDVLRKLDRSVGKGVGRLEGRVREVVDGDTIVLADGTRVRYLAIDTPERDTRLFRDAGSLNRALVAGRQVILHFPDRSPRDQFGRLLAAVFVKRETGPVLVNAELIRSGVARTYFKADDPVSERLRPLLIAGQKIAMEAKRGLWAAVGAEAERRVLITKNRFHRPDCRHIRGRDGPFRSREAALSSGRSPCRTCRP